MLHIMKPAYSLTITGEKDEDFRKYIARRLRMDGAGVEAMTEQPNAIPLDISLDDSEGDVVAGIAAMTCKHTLYIEMLWVHRSLRGQGIGRRLIQKAEDIAIQRGCTRARVSAVHGVSFYEYAGYTVCGKLQQFPQGFTIMSLVKELAILAEKKGPA